MALCSVAKIDLNWADNQYFTTLFNVLGEISKTLTPKEKKKITASEASQFIR